MVENRGGDGQVLLHHLADVVIVRGSGMLDVVEAEIDRHLQSFATVGVRGDPHSAPVRFVDHGGELFARGKRLVKHLAVLVEIERAGRVNLHVLDAVLGEFAHRVAHLIRPR